MLTSASTMTIFRCSRIFWVLMLLWTLGGYFSATAFAQGAAGTDITIIVMADDSDPDSIASNSSISKYINTKIKEQFSRYSYYVVSQDSVAAALGFDFSARRNTATVLRIAMEAKKSGKSEFDVRGIIIYKVYPRVKNLGFAKQIVVEISGEIHDADANRFLADFGPLVKSFPAPADCNDAACISGIVREKSADVAAMVADEARKKLALLTKGSASGGAPGGVVASVGEAGMATTFTVRLENLTMEEALRFKGTMEAQFPDFVRAGNLKGTEPIIEFGYTTKASQSKMTEWIYVLVKDLNITNSKIRADGTQFVVQRLGSDQNPPGIAPPPGGRFR